MRFGSRSFVTQPILTPFCPGLRTADDYRFYTISKAFPSDFSSKGKTLVFQFSVKHEQNIDCGGGYLKILPSGLDQANFNGDSKYKYVFF